MPQFKLSTSQGTAYFTTRYSKPQDVLRSFKTAVAGGAVRGIRPGVTVRSLTAISQQAFATRPSQRRAAKPAPVKAAPRPAPAPARPSIVDTINKALGEIRKQLQQLEQQSLSFQQGIPSPLTEMQELTEQAGIPELEQRLSPLQEVATRVGERMRGLPEELKQRFGEFLIPERFRERKEDVERGELTEQLETVQREEEIVRDAITEGKRRVTEVMKLKGQEREQQLRPLTSAIGFLRKRADELQQERSFFETRRKWTIAQEQKAAKAATSAGKKASKKAREAKVLQQLSTLANQIRSSGGVPFAPKISDEAAARAIRNYTNKLATQNPDLAGAIRAHGSSLIAAFTGGDWLD